MLKLEFVGEKPVISATGVGFDSRKHDKYEYIEPAAHILQMFLNLDEYNKMEKLEPGEVYGEEKILRILKEAVPNFHELYEESIKEYKKALEEEIADVEKQQILGEKERETLKKNYEFMKKYRIQRATNKIVYEEIINACVEILQKKRVTDVKAPFSNTFLHVLGSLKSTLEMQKGPRALVEVKLDTDTPYAQLTVHF